MYYVSIKAATWLCHMRSGRAKQSYSATLTKPLSLLRSIAGWTDRQMSGICPRFDNNKLSRSIKYPSWSSSIKAAVLTCQDSPDLAISPKWNLESVASAPRFTAAVWACFCSAERLKRTADGRRDSCAFHSCTILTSFTLTFTGSHAWTKPAFFLKDTALESPGRRMTSFCLQQSCCSVCSTLVHDPCSQSGARHQPKLILQLSHKRCKYLKILEGLQNLIWHLVTGWKDSLAVQLQLLRCACLKGACLGVRVCLTI